MSDAFAPATSNGNSSAPDDDPVQLPICSVLIVNRNGKPHLRKCLEAFGRQTYPHERLEILVIDNGSGDGSDSDFDGLPITPRVVRNSENGYAVALNLGLQEARGEFVVFANNDAFVEDDWVSTLAGVLREDLDGSIGCVGGKLLFEDGRINSVGHRALPGHCFSDEGFGEEDTGQFDTRREVDGVCWAAVMFRRACIDELLPIEEDYGFYLEDVDTSIRCRDAGWKIVYVPEAVARHRFHGSSRGDFFAEYYCARGRLIFVAKFHPKDLPKAIRTSRFVGRRDTDSLFQAFVAAIKKLFESHPPETVEAALPPARAAATQLLGPLAVAHALRRVEVILRRRRVHVALYDHALHLVGGGQRYGCEIAACLQDRLDVTLIANRPIAHATLQHWYDLRLHGCKIQIIRLPFFKDRYIDSVVVSAADRNPFETVARASAEADIFINVNMLPLVRPLSPFSFFICHFPDTHRRDRFTVDDYSRVLTNSGYTTTWTKKRWGIEPHGVLYPPVAMSAPPVTKENVILSVARFEAGGSKKQHLLIRSFEQLRRTHPDLTDGWRLVLVGGSLERNPYRDRVAKLVRESTAPVEMYVNVSAHELRAHYAKAKIFWHACGIGEDAPHLIEHFGMTVVEAMQNGCVPVVFAGGGPSETVEEGVSGFHFDSVQGLIDITAMIVRDPDRMLEIAAAATDRSKRYSREAFIDRVEEIFGSVAEEFARLPKPDPQDILKGIPRPDPFYSKIARRNANTPPVLPPPSTVAPAAAPARVARGHVSSFRALRIRWPSKH